MAARSDVYSGKGIPYLMDLSDFTLVWKREALKHSSSNRRGSLFSNTVAPKYLIKTDSLYFSITPFLPGQAGQMCQTAGSMWPQANMRIAS